MRPVRIRGDIAADDPQLQTEYYSDMKADRMRMTLTQGLGFVANCT
jgi:hypothetical protein